MDSYTLRRFARLGAEERILQIREEVARIYRQFPELRGTSSESEGTTRTRVRRLRTTARAEPSRSVRRRRRMSAEARQATSERMRKYWAQRRRERAAKKR